MMKMREKLSQVFVSTEETQLPKLVAYSTHKKKKIKTGSGLLQFHFVWWMRRIYTRNSNIKLNKGHKIPFQIAKCDEIWVCVYDPIAINTLEIQTDLQAVSGSNLNRESRCSEQWERRLPVHDVLNGGNDDLLLRYRKNCYSFSPKTSHSHLAHYEKLLTQVPCRIQADFLITFLALHIKSV